MESYSFGHWGPTSEEILKSQFPLHRACRDGDVEELSRLLIVAQNGIYEEDSFYGWTPAHWAAYFGKLNCLMLLLESGVSSDSSTLRLNQTALHISAFAGNSHCLKWLLHCGASINRQDYLGETCVHKAARTGSIECVSLLSSHGSRLYIRNNSGCLASEVAIMCGHEECAKYLDAATKRQEAELSEAKGVYQAGPDKHAITTPSPHDITVPHKVEPCVIMQGLNRGRLPPAGPGDNICDDMECEMETESQGNLNTNATIVPQNVSVHCKTDVTLSSKDVVVAGRKRAREDTDDVDFKRMRRSEPNNANLDGSCFKSRVEMNGLPINCVNGQFVTHPPSQVQENGSVRHVRGPMATAQGDNLTNSAIEHVSSVTMEHGYDSMLHEIMMPYNE